MPMDAGADASADGGDAAVDVDLTDSGSGALDGSLTLDGGDGS
jgi:hypothetical protein